MTDKESPTHAPDAALRYDTGKLRYDLLPPDAIDALVAVYTMGAQKYSDRNWEEGMKWSRVIGPLLRHAFAWMSGEDNDLESGLPHMAHVAWNALTLISYGQRKIGKDDRGKQILLLHRATKPPSEGAL